VNIAVVTDSTADIPAELALAYDIHIIPAILVVDEQTLEDGPDITRDELYTRLPGMKIPPTTAAPAIGAFQRVYEMLLKKGSEQIISIHVSSTLSSMYNNAVVAAKSFDKKVRVIDSRQVTLGMGFQVLAAAQAARENLPFDEIRKIVEAIRKRIHLVAMLDTLEYAYRSGRVSWARSNVTAFFRIKPFVGVVDGNVIRLGEARTRNNGIERLQKMLADLGSLEQLAVLHTNAEADAVRIAHRFESSVSKAPLIVNVTTLIGVHVGPNGLGFVAVTK
jgi:DegV family protein with EDD domain